MTHRFYSQIETRTAIVRMNLVGVSVHQPPLHPTAAHTRRKRNSEEQNRSKISVISAMERFVSAIDNMDKVVMIPCKLLDMSVPDNEESVPSSIRSESDLHSVYQMLLMLRQELQGLSEDNSRDIMSVNVRRSTQSGGAKRQEVKNAASSLSLSSLESVSSDVSDTDSDSGKQSDSDTAEQLPKLSSKCSSLPPHVSLADTFRMHLCGLQSTLDELTSSANYLSDRYQSEVGFW